MLLNTARKTVEHESKDIPTKNEELYLWWIILNITKKEEFFIMANYLMNNRSFVYT